MPASILPLVNKDNHKRSLGYHHCLERGINHENLVKIPTNSWEFSVFVNCIARSVSPKTDELQVLCHDVKADVVAVTESWLSEDIPSSVVHLNGYQE